MKRLLKALAVIAFVMAICFSFIACDNGTTSGGGPSGSSYSVAGKKYEMVDENLRLLADVSFTKTRFTLRLTFNVPDSGTYTISGNTITCTIDNARPRDAVIIFTIINENKLLTPYFTINGINTWTKLD